MQAGTNASDRYVEGTFDYNKCRLTFKADGKVFDRCPLIGLR